jgi:hypothetical protein
LKFKTMFHNILLYRPRVLLVLPAHLPSATIYITKPLKNLRQQGKIAFQEVMESEATISLIRSSDIVLFCRNQDPSFNWILEECLSQNIPTVYDLDDNLWEVPQDLPYAKSHHAPERIRQLEEYLTSVNLVRVFSEYLFDKVFHYNKSVCMVMPCIDMNLVSRHRLPREDDKIRITYITSRGTGDPLVALFADGLHRLLNVYSEKVEMYWWGEIPRQFQRYHASKLVRFFHDYEKYLHFISHNGFDIGLAPLTPTSFDLSKTNTKFRDYGAAWIAGIYSNVEVYSSCIKDRETGLLVENQSGAWFDAMSQLVADHTLRESIADAAYRFVHDTYRQELMEAQWEELFETLLKHEKEACSDAVVFPDLPKSQPVRLGFGFREGPPARFVGIDIHPCPGVSVIANLSAALPFLTGCADLIFIDHSQEDVTDPDGFMREIHRIGKHGAQVCIFARYSQPAFQVNNSHKHHFNEDTPRFWTAAIPPVYRKHWFYRPQMESCDSHRPVDFDIRCFRMEFFYYPEHLGLREDLRRRLRLERPHVCSDVLYHCVLVKQPVREDEIEQLIAAMELVEPQHITTRRLRDRNEFLKLDNDQLRRQLPVNKALAREPAPRRNQKITRLVGRLFDRAGFSKNLPSAFHRLLDDSQIFLPSLKDFFLQPSVSLHRVPYISYRIHQKQAGLCGIHIAPVLVSIPQNVVLGIEVVSPAIRIVVHTHVPATHIDREIPVHFSFPPLCEGVPGYFEFRIFTRDLDSPLRILEWHRCRTAGEGPVQTLPFFGFDFCSHPGGMDAQE